MVFRDDSLLGSKATRQAGIAALPYSRSPIGDDLRHYARIRHVTSVQALSLALQCHLAKSNTAWGQKLYCGPS